MNKINSENTPECDPSLIFMQKVNAEDDTKHYHHNPDVVKRHSKFLLLELTRSNEHYLLDD